MKQPAVATLATEHEFGKASRPVLFLLGRADPAEEPEPAHALFEAVASTRKHIDSFVATEAGAVLQAVKLGATPRPCVRWTRRRWRRGWATTGCLSSPSSTATTSG